MQQRGSNPTMETEDGEHSSNVPLSRSRQNSKLKVLVRSHAMREETSPPREPVSPSHHYNNNHASSQQPQLHSPRINLIPSPEAGTTSPLVMLSPTLQFSPGEAPASPVAVVLSPSTKSPQCLSPTATLVPSTPASRSSPVITAIDCVQEDDGSGSEERLEADEQGFATSSPKYLDKVNNIRNTEATSKQASHSNFRKKYHSCDCQNQNCIKCVKNFERNINNNISNVNNNVMGSPNMLTVSRASSRGKLRQQSSSLGSFESASNSPCLSRDNSSEQYTDTTGVDLEQFIPETLNRNAKDRALMLRIEQELVNLAKDKSKTHFKFPPMSSYQRMLVHRCAAYFGMDHNIEPTGKSVVVNKTKNTRIPDVEFKEHIKEDIIFSEEPRRSILKRDSNSIEDYSFKSPDRSFSSSENRRSKSFEEREEEYVKARRRIFKGEVIMHDGSSEDFGWSEMPWSSTESDYSSRYRLQPPDVHRRQFGKLIKVHSEDVGETMRPCVAKSYSFGGYGGNISVLSRGDSVLSTHSAGPRLLTKQDSGASSVSWRLSPSSSGYKSQSQMSESVTPSPTSTPHPVGESLNEEEQFTDTCVVDAHVVWAVTDIQNVPKGSIIINPQTGKALKNEDGSIYHYDPNNPPPHMVTPTAKPPPSPQKLKEAPPISPKKNRPSRTNSPIRKSNFTNSSTSPSLPFSPPLSTNSGPQRRFSYVQAENCVAQQFQGYASAYNTPSGGENVYQQPYIVYTAPYGVPIQQQYDGRMDPAGIPEVASTYYISEGSAPPPPQQITYHQPAQSAAYWNQSVQPVTFFQNNSVQPTGHTPPQRFATGPLQTQTQTGFVSTGYPTNYLTSPPSAQPPQNPDLVPVYPGTQPVQVVYQNQPTPPNPVIYQNQPPPVIYTHNPVYQPTSATYPPMQMTPAHNVPPYPQSTPTPNSCASSTSGHIFPGSAIPESQTFMQLTQSMQQFSLTGQGQPVKGPQPFDFRQRNNNGFKNKMCKNFIMGSSQSSTGTNSPAATVIAGYCPIQNPPGMYRTPPETPPAQFTYPPNFSVPPVMFKQMASVRASTPGTARSSRSPTPASDMSHFDRPRMPLPPNVYQGMHYVVPTDPRFIPNRNQTNTHRQMTQMNKSNFSQGSDNRSHNKNRKSKANKQSGLPPSGK